MDKLKMHTLDKTEENFKKLAELFPNAVTETVDENGEVVRAIDKDVLMQEISAQVVDGAQERYQFTWPDKKKSVVLANTPIVKTLRLQPEKSVGRDGTAGSVDSDNIYIEGDNLDALKLLQETYLGKVKMIYIDPPYNTGNDFVYNDSFKQDVDDYTDNSGQLDEEGNQLVQNTEGNGRFHTDWLNMIYPRLRLAKDLLTDDGVIFISIDDNECANLVKICNEVFGEQCFSADIAYQRTYSPRNDSQGISQEIEHILIYSRYPNWNPKKLPRTDKMNSKYKNPDNDVSPWRTSDAFAPNAVTHQGMVYGIQNPFSGEIIYPYKGACWPLRQSDMLKNMECWGNYELRDLNDADERASVCGITPSEVRQGVMGIVLQEPVEVVRKHALEIQSKGPWPRFFFTKNGEGGIARKTYLDDTDGRVVTNFWPYVEVGHTDEAKKEIKALFEGAAPFDTPKPTRLIKRMVEIATEKDSIILDFFSGSATTAQAVIEKNFEDSGNRKFILIQLQETSDSSDYSTICDIGEERIRRAGKKIKEDSPLTTQNLDVGFRVFKVDSSNMKDVYYKPSEYGQMNLDSFMDNIKEERTPEDLLIQVMLDLGVLLSSKIEQAEIAGKKVFSVADGYLIACFDKDVMDATVMEIAKRKPFYAVFRDSGMASDSVAANFEQIFETYSPNTVRKVL